ncbi:hypothetical protein CMI37_27325 [Candidatus Pacearchaeota archaeon]|nr:hypothetical protein [Candidatus Pacearchaeota archaeon]|tara:strand:- start:4377 stop:4679 length:303 start_codon:yes stop_codon:yes gene_type:complete
MTVENCLKHLEAYKKQAENPMSPDGVPYTGDQRKNAISTSIHNIKMMEDHILNSVKFVGGIKKINGIQIEFERQPIIDEILKERESVSKKEKPKPKAKDN